MLVDFFVLILDFNSIGSHFNSISSQFNSISSHFNSVSSHLIPLTHLNSTVKMHRLQRVERESYILFDFDLILGLSSDNDEPRLKLNRQKAPTNWVLASKRNHLYLNHFEMMGRLFVTKFCYFVTQTLDYIRVWIGWWIACPDLQTLVPTLVAEANIYLFRMHIFGSNKVTVF